MKLNDNGMLHSIDLKQSYIINSTNPDCGVGHAMGYLNGQLKVAMRHGLRIGYHQNQLLKSKSTDLNFKVKNFAKKLLGKKVGESHNIGTDIDRLFAPGFGEANAKDLLRLVRQKKMKMVTLPPTDIPTDWTIQNDDAVYRAIDATINSQKMNGVVFQFPRNWKPDSEYEKTGSWFREKYREARTKYPIDLAFDRSEINIAVHIRRGDLLNGRLFDHLSERMLPDEWYMTLLRSVLDQLDEKATVRIYSEGVDGKYCDENGQIKSWAKALTVTKSLVHVEELVDRPFMDTFHQMVSSDILIGSRSGMTHLAALISNGGKIVPSFWHSYRGVQDCVEIDGPLHDGILNEIKDLTYQIARRRR